MKKFYFLFFFIPVTFLGFREGPVETDWPVVTKESKPWTRWWWMGNDVDTVNLRYNLEEFSRAGIGGVEITPIYGVKGREMQSVTYLSPQWMDLLAFTESEGKRLNVGVDLSNGTGWPFGGPEIGPDDAATKAIFDLHPDQAPALKIGKTGQQVKRAAPGGQGFVLDHLNKEAVKRYLAKFDRAFAENNTGFPNSFFNDSYEVYGADWTASLLAEFESRRGYRLQDYFTELTSNGSSDTSARVIADYRETISELLLNNFTEVWTDWAHSHGSKTRNQAHGSPGNLIDIYAAVDIPECESFGITDFDLPGLRKDSIRKLNDSDPTILKYASSAAHLSGKKYTSAETFTWLTEHFRTSLSQCKPEIDLMFTSGVNHVFFHGATYSPKTASWPGYKFYAAVDLSPTNTIWKDAPSFFNYITRTQSFLQSGTPDNDFLLYFPIYDIWHEKRGNHFLPFAIHDVLHELPEFSKTVEKIRNSGFDLDYISDRFLETTTVENGMLKTSGGALYKALIFPGVKKLPIGTLSKVQDLIHRGATVVFSGNYPEDVPGLFQLEERREAFAKIMETLRRTPDVLPEYPHEAFITDFGGKMIRRKHDTGHIYFFTLLKNSPVNHWVPLAVTAQSGIFFDPMTGNTGRAKIRCKDGKSEVFMQLKPGQSLILKTYIYKVIDVPDWSYPEPTGKKTDLSQNWDVQFIDSDPAIKQTFHMENIGSWTDLANDTVKINKGTARYSKTFQFRKTPGKEYLLSLGDVRESAVLHVNGKTVATLFAVPFETPIGEYLKDGENRIDIDITNLPANRIADYDRQGREWRIFHDINFVNISYEKKLFDTWGVAPSGLLGSITIYELGNNVQR